MMESTSTVFCTYGLLTAEVPWQMVCFSCGAADDGAGQIQPRTTRDTATSAITADRVVRSQPDAPRFATPHAPCPTTIRGYRRTRETPQCPVAPRECQCR